MKSRWLVQLAGQGLLLGLAAGPLAASAQQSPAAAAPSWREANDLVGQFRRGHADVWKWEQSNPGAAPATAPAPAHAMHADAHTGMNMGMDRGMAADGLLSLPTADDAVRLAWRAHADLRVALAQLGAENTDRLARGQWDAVDPAMARRVHDFPELLEVAAAARKAWVDAVVAAQSERQLRAALEAAEAANALGARMVAVGNWSRLQHAPIQLAQARAHMAHQRAQYAATQAQARLLQTLQRTGLHRAVQLPATLAPLPSQPLQADAFAKRLEQVLALLPRGNALQHHSQATQGFAAYQASYAIARTSVDEVLRLSTFVSEETVLHYNGMLKSTWDVLAAAQSQSQAAVDAVAAQRDFEIAHIDLQWLLLGGSPASLVTLGASSADSAGPAGH